MTQEKIADSVLIQLQRLIKNYRLLTLVFGVAFISEIILLIFFLPLLFKSALFAITLAALLITFFSFYTIKSYQASEKEEVLKDLVSKYVKGVLGLKGTSISLLEVKQQSAETLLWFAHHLPTLKEEPPTWLPQFFHSLWIKMNPYFDGGEKILFQRLIFERAVEEFSGLVRLSPCDPQAHANLADTYKCISHLYSHDDPLYKEALLKSVEELKILSELAPQDTWAFEELAQAYSLLEDPVREIEALEKLREIDARNSEVLLRLGKLYFIQSQAAKGFKIYETLKVLDLAKSDLLMAHYH